MNNHNKYNAIILSNYQRIYPNLIGFAYDIDNDILSYRDKKVFLNGYGLSRIDTMLFNMSPGDILTYLQNRLYLQEMSSNEVIETLNKTNKSYEDMSKLDGFIQRFYIRYEMYVNNKNLFDTNMENNDVIKEFVSTLLNSRDAIKKLQKSNMFDPSIFKEGNGSKSNTTSLNNNQLEKGMTLSRNKPGFSGTYEDPHFINDEKNIGVSGFTSILFILLTVVTAGIFLALKIMP